MNVKFFKFTVCLIICGCIAIFLAKEAYCDQRNYPHIHIKGKILDTNGQPVSGASLLLESASGPYVKVPFVIGLPSDADVQAVATESGSGGSPCRYNTSATGEYHIVLNLMPDPHYHTLPDVNKISIDRSKMNWEKTLYNIRPK